MRKPLHSLPRFSTCTKKTLEGALESLSRQKVFPPTKHWRYTLRGNCPVAVDPVEIFHRELLVNVLECALREVAGDLTCGLHHPLGGQQAFDANWPSGMNSRCADANLCT